MSQQETLDRETRLFLEHLEEWRRSHLGEFVLIKGGDILGFFGSLDEAFAAGTGRFGLDPFFVKQVVPRDAVNISLFGRRLLTAR